MNIINNNYGKYRFFSCKNTNKKGTIVFIHGYATTSEYHDTFIEDATNEYDYITLELPGHGFMEYNHKKVDINFLVDYCVQLIQSLELDSFYLIGHSMGGGIAVRVANRLKDSLKGLVVVTPMNSNLGILEIKNYFKFAPNSISKTKKLINTIYKDPNLTITNKPLEEFISDEFKYQNNHKKFFVKLKKQMFSLKNLFECKKNEKKLDIPMLSLAGKFDKIIPPKSVFKSFNKNPQNKFILFENSAHVIFQEEQEFYNKTLIDFFNKLV